MPPPTAATEKATAQSSVTTTFNDTDRKSRIYGVIGAFSQGKLPSNSQIDSALQYLLDTLPLDLDQFSPDNHKLLQSTRQIIGTARIIFKEKNTDEEFQKFVWHARGMDVDHFKEGLNIFNAKMLADQQKSPQITQEALKYFCTLLKLMLSNSEVHKLISDCALIGRDILSKGAFKPADVITLSEQLMRNPNRITRNDQPVAKAGVTAGHRGTPLDAWIFADDDTDQQHFRRDEHLNVRSQETLEGSKTFWTEVALPEKLRNRLIVRAKNGIIECQKQTDYQNSILWLLSLFEEYAKTVGSLAKDKSIEVANRYNLTLCLAELRALVERFANGTSLNTIKDPVDALIEDANRDQALTEWFHTLDSYIRRVLLQPGYILEPECSSQAKHIFETGCRFYHERETYYVHFRNLFSSVISWFRAVGEDPLNKQFADDWASFIRDLLLDSKGKIAFKHEIWDNFCEAILPKLINHLGSIPIPRVEYTDDNFDIAVENLVLQGRDLFPDVVALEVRNSFQFYSYNRNLDESQHRIKIKLKHIQANIRDVAFYYKKTGFPKMEDSCIADIFMGKKGLSVSIELVLSPKNSSSILSIRSVRVKVGSLKFAIRNSKHNFLYNALLRFVMPLVKAQIEQAIRNALKTSFDYVNRVLLGVRDWSGTAKSKKTEDEIRDDKPIDVLVDLNKKKDKPPAKLNANAKLRFLIVTDKHSSLLVDKELSNRRGLIYSTERNEKFKEKLTPDMNEKGWRSDAFQIG